MQSRGRSPAPLRAVLLAVAVLAAACSKEAPQQQAVDVTAVTIVARDSPAVFEFVGQTQSSREVEIRARVDGFLERRAYTEGNLVKAGDTLFVMDQKPFQASLQQARGELAQRQARLQVAEANLARVKPLAAQNAVSQRDLDDAVGNEKSARAAAHGDFESRGRISFADPSFSKETGTFLVRATPAARSTPRSSPECGRAADLAMAPSRCRVNSRPLVRGKSDA
ncbi:MAG: biotin/lipoyl-binding protein [Burkholderiales bacterium]|nr:biotin/lipoyl-binding protein [Burkholderiales bacterium]